MSAHADPERGHLREEDPGFEGGETLLVSGGARPAGAPGEEIHMPDPSIMPILNAAAVTLMLLGVTSSKVLLLAGFILFLITTVLWIQNTRRELAGLPLEHGHH